jgi:hypothetical protein
VGKALLDHLNDPTGRLTSNLLVLEVEESITKLKLTLRPILDLTASIDESYKLVSITSMYALYKTCILWVSMIEHKGLTTKDYSPVIVV